MKMATNLKFLVAIGHMTLFPGLLTQPCLGSCVEEDKKKEKKYNKIKTRPSGAMMHTYFRNRITCIYSCIN